ncbi:unnamed protein product [Enterobius vermicularis]|uniref:Protein kinase domain-containing protein n=1 Tax=Enterobius vermicularis TaxID=51028 RepID=A0A0N4V2L1_ENTVE|nr:unnamed protein product [Enterobius vermicularis]
MEEKKNQGNGSWEQEILQLVSNPPLSMERRISGDESNALVMRSTGRRQTDVRKNGYKGNFLHLVLATMLDVFGDSVQDGCQKKAILQQLFIRSGWVPAIFMSDSYVPLRNSIRNMLNSCFPAIVEAVPTVDQSLALSFHLCSFVLATEIRFSPLATSRYKADFRELELIGKGGFGKVYKVQSRIDNRQYAVKKISFLLRKEEPMIKAISEVRTLASLQHKNIVRYFCAWAELDLEGSAGERHLQIKEVGTTDSSSVHVSPPDEIQEGDDDVSAHGESFLVPVSNNPLKEGRFWNTSDDESNSVEDCNKSSSSSSTSSAVSSADSKACVVYRSEVIPRVTVYVQMELCTRTLDDYFKARREVDQAFNENVISHLASALTYIHKQNIIHRDIKPCNLFLCDRSPDYPRVLLGDFGLACRDTNIDEGYETKQIDRCSTKYHSANVGTVMYSAPEQSSSCYDTSVDIYSAGIVAFELYCMTNTVMERNKKIDSLRKGIIPQDFQDKWPLEAGLIRSMCEWDPSKRPRAFEVADYLKSFVKQSTEMMKEKIAADRKLIIELREKIAFLEAELKRLKLEKEINS